MKFIKIFILALFLFPFANLQAQQEPLFAQYQTNAYLINPAVAGSRGIHSLNLFHRWQWVSFPGAPQTFGITYQGMLGDQHGIGGLLFSDITGPSSRLGLKASYAFHIPMANDTRLSLGLAGRMVLNRIRTNDITFVQGGDQAVVNASEAVFGGDAEFGIYYYGRDFYIGASAPNLIQTKIDFGTNPTNRDPLGKGYRHYFVTGGYKFYVDKPDMIIEPSIMVKYVQGPLPQIDGGAMVHLLDNQLGFGIFYRSPGFLSFQGKFVFDNSIPLRVSFDIATNNFQSYSVGATEVMLGYDFPGVPTYGPANQSMDVPRGKL